MAHVETRAPVTHLDDQVSPIEGRPGGNGASGVALGVDQGLVDGQEHGIHISRPVRLIEEGLELTARRTGNRRQRAGVSEA